MIKGKTIESKGGHRILGVKTPEILPTPSKDTSGGGWLVHTNEQMNGRLEKKLLDFQNLIFQHIVCDR